MCLTVRAARAGIIRRLSVGKWEPLPFMMVLRISDGFGFVKLAALVVS